MSAPEKMKTSSSLSSNSRIRSQLVLLLFVLATSSSHTASQIIGSSVVTSVSVVLGNESVGRSDLVGPSSSSTSEATSSSPSPPSSSSSPTLQSPPPLPPSSSVPSGRPTPPTFRTTTYPLPTIDTDTTPPKLKVVQPPTSKATPASASASSSPPPPPSTTEPPSTASSTAAAGGGSVSSVIATLKNIVQNENVKHHQQVVQSSTSLTTATAPSAAAAPSTNNPTTTTANTHTTPPAPVVVSTNRPRPTPSFKTQLDEAEEEEEVEEPEEDDDETEDDDDDLEDDDDDEEEDENPVPPPPPPPKRKKGTKPKPKSSSTTTTTTTTTSSPPTFRTLEPSTTTTTTSSNVTATSAEVHEAIHRISGELLTPGLLTPKAKQSSKAGAGSGGGGSKVKSSAPSTIKPYATSSKKPQPGAPTATKKLPPYSTTRKPAAASASSATKAPPAKVVVVSTTSKPSSAAAAPTQRPTTHAPQPPTLPTSPEPQIGLVVNKIEGLPTDGHDQHHASFSDDDLTLERETEEVYTGGVGSAKDDFAPFPSRKPPLIITSKPNKGSHSGSGSSHPSAHYHHTSSNNNNNRPIRPQIFYLTPSGSIISTNVHGGGSGGGGGGGKRKNGTGHGNRPTEFYDDEIFGYDPYQTFLHGVYVPVVELGGPNEPFRDTIGEYDSSGTTCTPEEYQLKSKLRPNNKPLIFATTRNPFPVSSLSSSNNNHNNHNSHHHNNNNNAANNNNNNNKPVPLLPDYLHRPRPSHLQYQHAVAETVDTETGLVTIKLPNPNDPLANNGGGGGGHDDQEQFISDRQTARPPPPIIPVPAALAHQDLRTQAPPAAPAPRPEVTTVRHNQPPVPAHEHDIQFDYPQHSFHLEQTHGPIEKRPSFQKAPVGNPGLETTITNLDVEMRSFVDLNNRLALRLLSSVTNPVSKAVSPSSTSYSNIALSPFTLISSLGMLFLGARGGTAAQLDGLLHLDDMLTFNPHLLYYNVTQSFLSQPNTAAAIIRLLIADKSKGDVLEFFKTRVQHFYDTRVEEADYKFAGHLAQSIINQMIRAQIQRHSYEMLNYSLPLRGPMSLLTAAFFDGQFGSTRDPSIQDMNFVHLASVGRRLIQVPAVAFTGPHRSVYDSELDATAVEVPYSTRDLSLILIMPGRPGEFGIGGVNSLKSRLTLETWTTLTRGFYPRAPFKVVFPRFKHQSSLNVSYTLQRFGLTDMFTPHLAKFKGINGLNDLYLDQNTMHFAEFATWEKLSDTLNEGTYHQHSHGHGHQHYRNDHLGNKKFDLVRILRPHVREHYGNYGEPISVGDWIFQQQQQSSLASAAAAAAAGGGGGGEAAANQHPAPRFSTTPYQHLYQSEQQPEQQQYNHRYQPFLSYSRVRSGGGKSTEPKFNLSQLFTRDSKTKRKPLPSPSGGQHSYQQNRPAAEPPGASTKQDGEEEVLRFERPFIYLLRHAPTGLILMCGQYTDPITSSEM